MSNKRHKHRALPKGMKFDEIDKDNRIWVLHPTKGIRSMKVFTPSEGSLGTPMLDYLRGIHKMKLSMK